MLDTSTALSALRRRRTRTRASDELRDGSGFVHRSINDAVRPCLVDIVRLSQKKVTARPEAVFEHVRSVLARTLTRLSALRLAAEERRDIEYALVAFIDEAMQLDPGPLKDFWQSHLLQLERFGETRAGEGFFDRLEHARVSSRFGVVRVYYLCLLLGFHGIYAQHGSLERENLIDQLQHALREHDGIGSSLALAPFGDRPDEPAAGRVRNQLLLCVAVLAAVMSIVVYLGLSFAVDAQEHALTESIEQRYNDLKLGVTPPAAREGQ